MVVDFDRAEVEADFARIAGGGFDSVRCFLLWEAFQPEPDRVNTDMLERLVSVADAAEHAGLAIVPTLFTGHMSGVDWIPGWALGGAERDARFRVVTGGRVVPDGVRNWYEDPDIVHAQARLASEAAAALAGHPALWAWDLGNENSNCAIPPDREAARRWLAGTTGAIREADPKAAVTIGIHMEDLEEIGTSVRRRPPRRATSSRCTATRSTRRGRTGRPTSTSCRSSRASRAGWVAAPT